mgnify:CR=1 FL=1
MKLTLEKKAFPDLFCEVILCSIINWQPFLRRPLLRFRQMSMQLKPLSLLKLFPLSPLQRALKDGKWGALDASGKVVIPLSYDKEAVSLSDSEDRKLTLRARRAVTT